MGRRILAGIGLLILGAVLGAVGILLWQRYQPADSAEDVPARSWEATVYLPVNDNAGRPFPQDDWNEAVGVLVRRFGGATLGPTRQRFWLTNGRKVQSEPVRLVTVSFDRGRLGQLREAVREVGRRLGQETVYVRLEEPRIELIAVPAAGGKKGG
jgi:hypothetical protein